MVAMDTYRCPEGHIVAHNERICPECGSPLVPVRTTPEGSRGVGGWVHIGVGLAVVIFGTIIHAVGLKTAAPLAVFGGAVIVLGVVLASIGVVAEGITVARPRG